MSEDASFAVNRLISQINVRIIKKTCKEARRYLRGRVSEVFVASAGDVHMGDGDENESNGGYRVQSNSVIG